MQTMWINGRNYEFSIEEIRSSKRYIRLSFSRKLCVVLRWDLFTFVSKLSFNVQLLIQDELRWLNVFRAVSVVVTLLTTEQEDNNGNEKISLAHRPHIASPCVLLCFVYILMYGMKKIQQKETIQSKSYYHTTRHKTAPESACFFSIVFLRNHVVQIIL